MTNLFHDSGYHRRSFLLLSLSALLSTAALASPEKLVPVKQDLPDVFFASKLLGAADPSEKVTFCISLNPRDSAGLEGFVASVSDPKSANYRHFIGPDTVGELFGAPKAQVVAAARFFEANGMKVVLVAANRMAVSAEGTVAQAEKAFGVRLVEMEGPSADGNGTYKFRSFVGTPMVPATFGASVNYIEGLDNSSRPKHMTTLTPSMHKVLYSLATTYNGGNTGLGRTIGITNWGDGYKLSNIPLFYSHFSLPTPSGGLGSNVHTVLYNGGSASHGAAGETDLDMQLALGQAPLADLYLYDDGANGSNHVTMLAREGTDNLCDILSESWGWSNITGGTATSLHNQYVAMQAQGMTYLCASGDSGTQDVYDYPDFDPTVLSVGGTIATTNGTGTRSSETGWSGSGGGYSNKSVSFNVKPAWQTGNGVLTGINFRLFPDISGHAASGSGAYQFYYNGGLSAANGTSLSSPSMAGSLAIVEQRLIGAGLLPPDGNGKRRFGHMQELIYGQNGRSDAYYDVLSGNNGNLYNGSASTCHAGWDSVTGWGCFNYEGFVQSLLPQDQTVAPDAMTLNLGQIQSGSYTDLAATDSSSMVVCKAFVPNFTSPFVRFVLDGTTTKTNLTSYKFKTNAKMNSGGTFQQTIEAYNFTTSTYDVSNTAAINLTAADLTVTVPSNFNDYLLTGILQARVSIKQAGFSAVAVPCVSFDSATWTVAGS